MQSAWRIKLIQLVVLLSFGAIFLRLFYWQVLTGSKLQAVAQAQHQSTIEIPAARGKILSQDGFSLVSNQPAFLAFAYTRDLDQDALTIATKLAPLLAPKPEDLEATPTAELTLSLIDQTKTEIQTKLTTPQTTWIPLNRRVTPETKNQIDALGINGLGFEEYEIRQYPEASMAAQLLGFVGSDGTGKPKGYFGLEGFYNFELTGKPGFIRQETDAYGRPIVIGNFQSLESRNGRTLKTHLHRGIQLMVEKALEKGIETYGASAGEVIIMDPKTGGILALAGFPKYDPVTYKKYPQENYRIQSISDTFEPGSIFKVLVMAAGIDAGAVSPDTVCDDTCNGMITMGAYTIKTWNDEYHPGQTMTEVLKNSDNTGMIFVAKKLGQEKFVDYLNKFGIGEATNIDLESETVPKLRSEWKDIDLATGSFGQGLVVTSIQMLRAVAAIANDGKLMEPRVVEEVVSRDGSLKIKPKVVRQVIKPETAQKMRLMMEESAEAGEAKWAIPKGYNIAGKTGTAQIVISGHYDAEKTIASFVGFAPAQNPKFVMLVKLKEPQSSQWASETAAPLWFSIAKELFYHLNIEPQN